MGAERHEQRGRTGDEDQEGGAQRVTRAPPKAESATCEGTHPAGDEDCGPRTGAPKPVASDGGSEHLLRRVAEGKEQREEAGDHPHPGVRPKRAQTGSQLVQGPPPRRRLRVGHVKPAQECRAGHERHRVDREPPTRSGGGDEDPGYGGSDERRGALGETQQCIRLLQFALVDGLRHDGGGGGGKEAHGRPVDGLQDDQLPHLRVTGEQKDGGRPLRQRPHAV